MLAAANGRSQAKGGQEEFMNLIGPLFLNGIPQSHKEDRRNRRNL